jgi:hypothetical protein
MWSIANVKKAGRLTLKANYFVVFVACLVLAFVVYGPMSVSEYAQFNENVLKAVAEAAPGTPLAKGIDGLVDGAEKFRKSTSLGTDASEGNIGKTYKKIAAAGGVHELIVAAVNRNIADGRLGANALQLLSLLGGILIYIFIGGVLDIGRARLLLEARAAGAAGTAGAAHQAGTARAAHGAARDIRLSRIFFIYRIGRTRRAALIVFLRALYLFLWAFTVVGLPIKYYQYRLVPYLVAENPDIDRREVFKLSARLMKGHKLRMFLFDLSFVPLFLLSVLTFGIVMYVWLGPYYNASKAELYAQIRGEALTLKDRTPIKLPSRLEGVLSHVGAKPQYSPVNIALMFILFSFIGWIYECTLWLVEDGILVNRGTMYGPWIPIYGVGGLVIITIVNRFHRRPLVCFFMIIAVCAPIEYIGGLILWQTRHLKYWDYSGYFLNLQGRICLESMLNFAILGIVSIYVIAPVVDSLLNRVPLRTRRALCGVLFALFCADAVCAHIWPRSGKGITSDLQ